MIQLVKEFTSFSLKIGEYIENSNYKTKYFIDNLNLSKATFYRKLKENSFTVSEINTLTELLYPIDYYDWKLKRNIETSIKQHQNGESTDAREDLNNLRAKYQNQ